MQTREDQQAGLFLRDGVLLVAYPLGRDSWACCYSGNASSAAFLAHATFVREHQPATLQAHLLLARVSFARRARLKR